MNGEALLAHGIAAARSVRAELLSRRGMSRKLAGQCGLASMRVAKVLGDPRVLRVGFFMKVERFLGRRGRFPSSHAWCRLDNVIVDPTATQFIQCRAVHVVSVAAQDRYVETGRGLEALDEIMNHWRGRRLPEYVHLARQLRRGSP